MADTNRISIAETDARNAHAPRAVGLRQSGGGKRLSQSTRPDHSYRSDLLIGETIVSFSRFFISERHQCSRRPNSVLPSGRFCSRKKNDRDHGQGHRTPGQGRKKVPMRLTLFIPCSIAAVFPHADEATLEAVGKFDRWIHCGQPELSVAGLLVPWIMFVGALGFLAAWLVMAILERTGLSRHLWHLPLFFVALLVLFSSLIGALFFP
jgi:Protein of unknown function (DUF1656)